jgi:hypothetical protein
MESKEHGRLVIVLEKLSVNREVGAIRSRWWSG